MPYLIRRDEKKNKYCVYKESPGGEPEGDALGCHPSRRLAQKQVKALYANVKERRENKLARRAAYSRARSQREFTEEIDMLEEAVTKTVDGKQYPASDFLVVEDSESPDTWHLQVKRNGKPDRDLMGGAWAALHKGHRGEKYAGPNKAEALRKLKALYKAEGAETPVEEMEVYETPVGPVYGVTSFADLYAVQAAAETAQQLEDTIYQFGMLARNITDSGIEDKEAALATLAREFIGIVKADLGVLDTEPQESGARMKSDMLGRLSAARKTLDEIHTWGSYGDRQQETAESSILDNVAVLDAATEASTQALTRETAQELDEEIAAMADVEETEQFAESIDGASITFVEAETVADGGRRAPVKLDVALIKPGWGNKRDMHYYPVDTLKRDAHVFEGAKMYATDHRADEKSVRTEVSRIERIKGFTDDGAPVAEVTVFEPDFAEMVRNRADAGLLNTLECSILASGKAVKGEVNGVKGKVVEAITSAQSVDWVTKAGAGGAALQLSESEAEQEAAADTDTHVEASVETEAVQLTEEETQSEQQVESVQEETSSEEVVSAEQVAETVATFAEAEAAAIIAESVLPAWAQDWLREQQWESAEALQAGITRAIQRVKKATRSGEVFGQGAPMREAPASPGQIEERRKQNFNEVMRRYGAREV